jgi:hypothetical protein
MPVASGFRTELRAQIDRARKQGRPHVEVNAAELYRVVVGSLPTEAQSQSMPACCDVMRDEMKRERAQVVFETEGGPSPALTIRYYLVTQ